MRRDPRRARLVLTLLLLTAFTLLTVDVRSGRDGVLSGVRSGLGHVFDPIGHAVSSGFRPVGDAFSAAFHSERDRKARQRLEQEIIKLKRTAADAAQAQADAKQLAGLADLAFRGKYTIVGASIIATGAPVADFQQVVTIDAGLIDGVRKGQLVTSIDGLVGRVVAVQSKQCQVELITDDSFVQGVQQVDNAAEVQLQTVHGQGQGQLLSFTLNDTRLRLTKGARLVTYPGGTLQGIPVGEVDQITSVPGQAQTALVRPYAHLDSLDVVGVVVAQERGGPRSAISPSPSPSPPAPPSPSPSGSLASASTPGTTTGTLPSANPPQSPAAPLTRSSVPAPRTLAPASPSKRTTSRAPTSGAASSGPRGP